MEIFEAHRDYREHGILPESGGKKDQASVLVEAFKVLDRVNIECDEIKKKQDERKEAGRKQAEKLRGGG